MSRPDSWAINGIVLAHLNRFSFAASKATQAVHDRAGSLLGLVGNLTWAASPFGGGGRQQEAGMALLGALLGSLGPDAAGNAAAPAPLAALEREFFSLHDQILTHVENALALEGPLSPAQVNRRVWEIMFPQLPYGTSLDELADVLQGLLVQAASE
jgi:hypothetical protein